MSSEIIRKARSGYIEPRHGNCRYCQKKMHRKEIIWQHIYFLFKPEGARTKYAGLFEEATGVDLKQDLDWFPTVLCRSCKKGVTGEKLTNELADWDVSTPEREALVKERLENIRSIPRKSNWKKSKRKAVVVPEATDWAVEMDEHGVTIDPEAELPPEDGYQQYEIEKTADAGRYLISNNGNAISKNIVNLENLDENIVLENNPFDQYLQDEKVQMIYQLTHDEGGKILLINGKYIFVEDEIQVFHLNGTRQEEAEVM